jgi:DNA-binding GntR family transcriptional regulator
MTLRRDCMSDRIRQALTERILSGDLRPGERLVELKVAAEMNTSQGPVREALRELEARGLVTSEPFRGTRVRTVSEEEMAQAYAVRAVLERAAGEWAAPHLRHNTAQLRAALAGLHAAARSADRDAYTRHDLDFHRAIVRAAGNAVLSQAWEGLAFETRILLTLYRKDLNLVDVAGWHDAIVDALDAGDGARAGELLYRHSEAFARMNRAGGQGKQEAGGKKDRRPRRPRQS